MSEHVSEVSKSGRKRGSSDRVPRVKPVRTPAATGKSVKLLAEGKSIRAVAAATGQSVGAVHRTRQENLDQIATLAAQIFNDSLTQIEPTVSKLVSRVDKTIESGTAQEVDQVTRALGAVGKFVSNASGADESGQKGGKVEITIVFRPHTSRLPEARVIDARSVKALPLPAARATDDDMDFDVSLPSAKARREGVTDKPTTFDAPGMREGWRPQ